MSAAAALPLFALLAGCGLTTSELRSLGDAGPSTDTRAERDVVNPTDVPPGVDVPPGDDVPVSDDVPVADDTPVLEDTPAPTDVVTTDTPVPTDVPTTCPGSCDDGNPCTDDACVAGSCRHTENANPCDDHDACTSGDRCAAGRCTGAAVACDDGNPCTDDSCAPATGCAHAPNSGSCPGGTCNGAGMCSVCSAGASCSTGNACTRGAVSCPAGTCAVSGNVAAGTACAGGVCNGAGACVACSAGASCSTGNPCTTGAIACSSGAPTCVAGGNVPAGGACPGGVCNGSGACVACGAGAACSTGNPCTTGAIVCSSGAPVCTATGNAAMGTTCPGGTCNGSGTCTPTTTMCGGVAPETGPPNYSRESAGTAPAGASTIQQTALVRANHWRTSVGVAPFNENARLNTSATNHANFCNANPQSTCWPNAHDETSTCAGYTGHWPWDRMTAAGYTWTAAAEDMAFVTDPTSAIDEWIWTVYHRDPILSNAYVDMGYGETGAHDVLDFGANGVTASAPAVGLFPVPGQTGVPRSFGGNEGPMPPSPPGGFPSGPVISVSLNANGTVTDHQLWDASCNPVAHTYSNSDGSGGTSQRFFYFYANTPLAAATRYTVRVGGTVGSTSFSHTWVFTTM